MIFDKLYFRHWDEYDNHKNSHVFILHLGRARDPASDSINLLHGRSNLACPVPPHGDGSHYDISPDGKEIVFASMQDYNSTNQAYSTNVSPCNLIVFLIKSCRPIYIQFPRLAGSRIVFRVKTQELIPFLNILLQANT